MCCLNKEILVNPTSRKRKLMENIYGDNLAIQKYLTK